MENSNEIVQIIEVNRNNFRNLIFFLEHFKTIFYPIQNLFNEEKEFAIQKTEKSKAILDFTLAITIEYKLGLLNSTNLEDVKGLNDSPFAKLGKFDVNSFLQNTKASKEKEENPEPSYIDVFKNKYFSKNKYYFFKSIFEYITGIKAFQVNSLKSELEEYFIVKDGKIPDHEKLLLDLGYINCLKLTDKEYQELTRKMLEYLDNGLYQLRQYGTVFHFATRFNNILNFKFDKLKIRFIKGIKKAIPSFIYNNDLGFYMSVGNETEFKDDVIEIIKYCLEINESLKVSNEGTELKNLFDLFLNDFDAFILKVSERDNEFRFSAFWFEFDMNKIITRINKLGNDQIWNFGHYFKNRYRKHIFERLYSEKEFVIDLIKRIDNPTIKRKIKNLHNASLDYLSKCLKESELNFPG